MKTTGIYTIRIVVLWTMILSVLFALTSCGVGVDEIDDNFIGENELETVVQRFFGRLLFSDSSVVIGATIVILNTGTSGTTDSNGEFVIESEEELSGDIEITVELPQRSLNTVTVSIPEFVTEVTLELVIDQSTLELTVSSVEFVEEQDELPSGEDTEEPVPSPTISPEVDDTVASPTPSPEPEQSGPFDEDGNTNSFGIPPGRTGNISKGKKAFNRVCADHHPSNQGRGLSYSKLRSVSKLPQHQGVNFDLANLTAYLNRHRR